MNQQIQLMQLSYGLKRNRLIFVFMILLGACNPCGNDYGNNMHFYNQTGASVVFGVFAKSKTFGTKMGITQSRSYYGAYSYDTENGEYLFNVDWRLSDYVAYSRDFPFYGSNELGTDSIYLPVATSRYNLWKWLESRNSLYLLTLIELPLQYFETENDKRDIVCNPPIGCYFNVIFGKTPSSTAVGLYFHSDTLGERLGTDQKEFMSIIGTRWWASELKCPLGFGNENTFGDFFTKCGINEITILLAESEDQLLEWEKSHNDNVLVGKQVYDLSSLGPKQSAKNLQWE